MNKYLAIAGSVAGVISAGVLMMGMSSIDTLADFPGCITQVGGPMTSRDLQWVGSKGIDIRIPASVHFTVGPSWRAVATGPAEVLDRLRMNGGEIEFEPSFKYCGSDVQIELAGPEVRSWDVRGSGDLMLEGLNQNALNIYVAGSGSVRASGSVRETRGTIKGSGDVSLDNLQQQRIELDIHGSGSATARGTAESTRIAIYGSGTAHFGELEVKSASVLIHGSGNVFIAPIDRIDALLHGSGDVHLLAAPKQVQQQIHGSGKIRRGNSVVSR